MQGRNSNTGNTGSNRSNQDLIILTALFAAGIVVFEVWMATTNHDNSRDQHLGGAVAYARGHIDLLRPMLPGFNANGTPTPLDFPVWQAATAVLMKCFGLWYGWGNIVSLVFYFSSLWALFDLCRRMDSPRAGWWAMLFSLVAPVSFLFGGQAGGDSTAHSFAIWFIYFAYRMMSEGRWTWWGLALLSGGLSVLTKMPFFFCAGLTAFFWLWCRFRSSGLAWFFLVSTGAVSGVLLLVWHLHCHRAYAEAEFPTINMDVYDAKSGVNSWYFGTLAYRLNLHNWLRGGWHMMSMIFGGFNFILLLLISIRLKKTILPWLWLLAALCTLLVFPMLLLEHMYYFLIFAPATAWLCAAAAAEVEPAIWRLVPVATWMRSGILFLTFAATLASTFMIIHINMYFDPYLEETARLIKQHTAPDDKIVVWGMLWGSPFFRAEREGVTASLGMTDTSLISDPVKLRRLKQLGYKKIVLINSPPFAVALTTVTGKRDLVTGDLHQCLPPVAKDWPVVFDTTQLLIVQIPD
jgi:hypothetical protein